MQQQTLLPLCLTRAQAGPPTEGAVFGLPVWTLPLAAAAWQLGCVPCPGSLRRIPDGLQPTALQQDYKTIQLSAIRAHTFLYASTLWSIPGCPVLGCVQ